MPAASTPPAPHARSAPHLGDAGGLTIKNMRTFFWLARLENYHAVARHLNVTQPAVTARIAALENELGISLFSRGQRTFELSPEGKDALRMCEEILDAVDTMRERFSGTREQLGGIARIGVVDTVARTWLPTVLDRVRREYPNVVLEITNEGTLELHTLLKNGTLSMSVTIDECDDPDVTNTVVGRYEVEWVASPGLIDANRVYTVEELMQFPLIGYVAKSPPDVHLRRYLGKHYSSGGIRNTTNSMSTMIWLAENGLGIAAIPPHAVEQHIASGRLALIRTRRRFEPMTFYLNCRNRPYSPVVRVIETLVREEAAKFDRKAR